MKTNGNVTGSKPVEGDGFPPLLVIVLDGKGGVSKSVISGAVVFGFETLGEVMAKFDTDTTNSTLTAMYEDARLIDVHKADWSAPITYAISQIGNDGVSRMLLIDTGARDEAKIKERLPLIATKMAAVGGRLLVIRPITTSNFAQTNAIEFAMSTANTDIGVVFMRVVAQGRTEDDFDEWLALSARKAALAAGAVDTFISDLGVKHADNAVAYGLSFVDVAMGRFEKCGEDENRARKDFNPEIQGWFMDWLDDQTQRWLPAFHQALRNREKAKAKP
ncbi:hypothetical protein [Bosea vaviloviae]|uniref:CobQ/CobB/MinD/ParA nucleotide binding domain-containing protein n=1 Tax=Bosea vaviloviae TaxID=1526658 RepID=A0A0N1F418_9HYPH|nr:hypothetical protein [Bosea vaviloviae]KPH80804.1 hypothetical protein AE618_11285 [Bosea vaviloviae]